MSSLAHQKTPQQQATPPAGASPAHGAATPAQGQVGNQAVQSSMTPQASADQDGAMLGAVAAREKKTARGSSSTEVRAGGSLELSCVVIPGTDPPELEFTIRLTMGAGLDAQRSRTRKDKAQPGTPSPGAKAKGKGKSKGKGKGATPGRRASTSTSLGLSAQVGAVFEQTRRVPESKAEEYVRLLDEAVQGQVDSRYPELAVIASESAKWTGAIEQADELLDQALGEPEGARKLAPGDSFSLVTDASLSGSAGVDRENPDKSRFSGNAQIEASGEWKRVVKVEREGPRATLVTVGFVEASRLAGSASGGNRFGSMSLEGHLEDSSSQTVRCRLDPEHEAFDREYRSLVRADSADEVKSLAVDLESGDIADARLKKKTGRGYGVSGGSPVLTLTYGQQSSGSEDVRIEDGKARGFIDGRFSDEANLEVLGMGFSSSESSEVSGKVGKDGEASVDLAHDKDGLLTETELNGQEFDRLVARAQDLSVWKSIASLFPDAMKDWLSLRKGLVYPQLDRFEAAVDRKGAKELAQLRAISAYVQSAGNVGMKLLQRCLDYAGDGVIGRQIGDERFGFSYHGQQKLDEYERQQQHGGLGLGRVSDWEAEDLREQKALAAQWDLTTETGPELTKTLQDRLKRHSGAATDTAETWTMFVDSFEPQVERVMDASAEILREIPDKLSGRTMVDTLAEITEIRQELREAWMVLVGRAGGEAGDRVSESADVALQDADIGLALVGSLSSGLRPAASKTDSLEKAQAMAHKSDLQSALYEMRKEEMRLLQAAYAEYEHGDDFWQSSRLEKARAIIKQVDGMYLHWEGVFDEYMQCRRTLEPDLDLDKVHKKALSDYGPNLQHYDDTTKEFLDSRSRGFHKRKVLAW